MWKILILIWINVLHLSEDPIWLCNFNQICFKKQWHKILLEIICKLCSSPSSFLKLVGPFYSWLCCILAAVGDVLAAVWCNHPPPLFFFPQEQKSRNHVVSQIIYCRPRRKQLFQKQINKVNELCRILLRFVCVFNFKWCILSAVRVFQGKINK